MQLIYPPQVSYGLIFLSFLLLLPEFVYSQVLKSPDGKIELSLQVEDKPVYTLSVDNQIMIKESPISLSISGFREDWRVRSTSASESSTVLLPEVWIKQSKIQDYYNQLIVNFRSGISLTLRAYDNGVAWSWSVSKKGSFKVLDEQVTITLDKDDRSWYPADDNFLSHDERLYQQYTTQEIDSLKLAGLPVLFEVNNTKLLFAESDLNDYPGLWLRGTGDRQIIGSFAAYPKKVKLEGDRTERVVEREDFIAQIGGTRTLPWRILMVAREDQHLIANQLVYQLARPSEGDYSWVKPGKVQWDWWNANNITGVDFRAGINNQTYKYYIDFASENNIKYVILDEGWSDASDLTRQTDGIDVRSLAEYAETKSVGLILWANWYALRGKQIPVILDQFAEWGIKGIKVDFMQRDDQWMVNYYWRIARAAAERKLMVDFHGGQPAGLHRTYPNVMSYEGVLGLEHNKWGDIVNPEHNVTIPFIRMVAGPMDYTPGAMLNAQKDMWRPVWTKPISAGTRVHQLAMYVIYESPLQMLCDNPTHYLKEPECMDFIKHVPVEWQESIPLSGKVGDYVAMARQSKSGDWYVGAMTDWEPRELTIDTSFLPDGAYSAQVWKDGINADRNAEDFARETLAFKSGDIITIRLAPGGGWVAVLRQNK